MPSIINTEFVTGLIPNIKREVKLSFDEYNATFDDLYARIVQSGKHVYTTESKLLKATPNGILDLDQSIIDRAILIGKDSRRGLYVVYTLVNDSTDPNHTTIDGVIEKYADSNNLIDKAIRTYISINDPRTIQFKFLLMDQIVERTFKKGYFFIFDMGNGRNNLQIINKTY